MVAKRHDQMTVEEFLALDRESLDQKYEFRNGQMVAMSGGTINHSTLIGNTFLLIRPHFRNKPCRVLTESTLKIEDESYLPDIMVTCDDKDVKENKTYVERPKLVIEVLSPSTENNDRRDKLWAYTRCFSIQEYILVNWDCKIVHKMTRKGTQDLDRFQWIDQWYSQGEDVELETINLSIPVDEIYAEIELPPFDPFRGFRKRKTR